MAIEQFVSTSTPLHWSGTKNAPEPTPPMKTEILNQPFQPPPPVKAKRPAPIATGPLATAIAAERKKKWIEYRAALSAPTDLPRLEVLARELGREAHVDADASAVAKAKALADRLAGRADALAAKNAAMAKFNEAIAERDRVKAVLREAERAASNAASEMNLSYNAVNALDDVATELRGLIQKNAALLTD